MRKQPWNNRLLFLCPFFKKGTGKMELLILIISILAFLLELFVFWSCMMAGRALDEEMKCYEYEKEKKHKKKLPDKLAGSGKRSDQSQPGNDDPSWCDAIHGEYDGKISGKVHQPSSGYSFCDP